MSTETWRPDAEPWEALREADRREAALDPDDTNDVRSSGFWRRLAKLLSEMGWHLTPGPNDFDDGYSTGYEHGRKAYAFAREAELEARVRQLEEALRDASTSLQVAARRLEAADAPSAAGHAYGARDKADAVLASSSPEAPSRLSDYGDGLLDGVLMAREDSAGLPEAPAPDPDPDPDDALIEAVADLDEPYRAINELRDEVRRLADRLAPAPVPEGLREKIEALQAGKDRDTSSDFGRGWEGGFDYAVERILEMLPPGREGVVSAIRAHLTDEENAKASDDMIWHRAKKFGPLPPRENAKDVSEALIAADKYGMELSRALGLADQEPEGDREKLVEAIAAAIARRWGSVFVGHFSPEINRKVARVALDVIGSVSPPPIEPGQEQGDA